MNQTLNLSGVHVIMPTPFTGTGELDLDSLAGLTDFLVGLGVQGLVVLGVLGEAPKLGEAEQEAVIRQTVATAAGRVPVLVGSGAGGTDLAIQKSARAMSLGASGLLVAPPPVQSDPVILEYYRRIGAAVGAPIVLHDYPATTGILLSPALILRLAAEVPQVAAVKLEDLPSAPKITAIRAQNRELSILGGLGGMFMLEELGRGANGIMTGFSYPDILLAIYRAYTAGNLDEARRVFFGACALMRYEFQPGTGLCLRKEIYRRRGAIAHPYVRHPGAQLDDHLRAELDQVLDFTRPEDLLAPKEPRP